jgi:hypothetical protein
MNERLQNLAREAGHFEFNKWDYFDINKFAELIVEECRYVMDCNKGSDQNPAWNQALSETSLKIKQHFGVEE